MWGEESSKKKGSSKLTQNENASSPFFSPNVHHLPMSSIESTTITPEDEVNLELAYAQAQKSLKEGGVPIGSVVRSSSTDPHPFLPCLLLPCFFFLPELTQPPLFGRLYQLYHHPTKKVLSVGHNQRVQVSSLSLPLQTLSALPVVLALLLPLSSFVPSWNLHLELSTTEGHEQSRASRSVLRELAGNLKTSPPPRKKEIG